MGRFKKLETGGSSSDGDEQPDEGAFGLRTRVTRRRETDASGEHDYDQGHYQADGDRLFYSGEYQKALRSYSRAMEVDHSAVEPWIGQVLTLIKLKQSREATMWAMRAVELFPESADLVSLQGLALALTGANQRSIACSDYSMTLPGGGSAFGWLIRAVILARADNPNAGYCYEKIKELRNPADWRVLALAGSFLIDQKKWASALEFLRLATEAQPANPWLWNMLGLANEKLGFNQPAMQAYRSALEINPNNRDARDSVARLTSVPLPVRLWRRIRGLR